MFTEDKEVVTFPTFEDTFSPTMFSLRKRAPLGIRFDPPRLFDVSVPPQLRLLLLPRLLGPITATCTTVAPRVRPGRRGNARNLAAENRPTLSWHSRGRARVGRVFRALSHSPRISPGWVSHYSVSQSRHSAASQSVLATSDAPTRLFSRVRVTAAKAAAVAVRAAAPRARASDAPLSTLLLLFRPPSNG